MNNLPDRISDENQLEELLSRPGQKLIEFFRRLNGDIIFLGIDGKIGPSLAEMALRANREAGIERRIIGISRFAHGGENALLRKGIEIMKGDLLDPVFLQGLPDVKNVFFLAGMKFGAEENLAKTWAVNTYLPAMVAGKFKNSRIVAFSTGCVYPLVPVESGGSVETGPVEPVGEYAQSCLGRERMFEYGSLKNGTQVLLIRLNYAVEMRYGVLVDIALKVKNSIPVDLTMGYFNAIWQGDSNNFVLRSLELCSSPARILNITGKEILSVRQVAQQFGKLLGKVPAFINTEETTALLNNPDQSYRLFGNPQIPVNLLIEWIASWISGNQRLLNKSTHFEIRNGKY